MTVTLALEQTRRFSSRSRRGGSFVCGCQSARIVGNVMENTHLPLTQWFLVISLLSKNKNAISAFALRRQSSVPVCSNTS